MQMETFTKVTGSMTKLMAKERTSTLTGLGTWDSGKKTNSMDEESKCGPMELSTKVITSKDRKKERALSIGQTGQSTMGSS
jgi:hypothetical protein